MPDYLLQGRLAEDGQTMDFPVLENGILKPLFRASYNVHTRPQRDYAISDNLVYLAVSSGTILEFGEREIPVPFKDRQGNVQDVRKFRLSAFSITTEGLTLAKIHPRTPYMLKAADGTQYHSFEMLETPEKYRNPNEMAFDFVYQDEGKGLAVIERGSRIIKLPGAVLFPDYCAFRLPGWLAKEFNGSPEFGFSYAPFTEPRKGELLHAHQKVMEPYMCIGGIEPFFVGVAGGSRRLAVRNQEGETIEYRGEIFKLQPGDVLLPLPNVPHKIVFDGAQFPFAHYCPNYAAQLLDEVSDDRVVLEKQ